MFKVTTFTIAALTGAALLPAAALAAQGPGIRLGAASATTQFTMAVIVHGAAALVIAAGLLGTLRHH